MHAVPRQVIQLVFDSCHSIWPIVAGSTLSGGVPMASSLCRPALAVSQRVWPVLDRGSQELDYLVAGQRDHVGFLGSSACSAAKMDKDVGEQSSTVTAGSGAPRASSALVQAGQCLPTFQRIPAMRFNAVNGHHARPPGRCGRRQGLLLSHQIASTCTGTYQSGNLGEGRLGGQSQETWKRQRSAGRLRLRAVRVMVGSWAQRLSVRRKRIHGGPIQRLRHPGRPGERSGEDSSTGSTIQH